MEWNKQLFFVNPWFFSTFSSMFQMLISYGNLELKLTKFLLSLSLRNSSINRFECSSRLNRRCNIRDWRKKLGSIFIPSILFQIKDQIESKSISRTMIWMMIVAVVALISINYLFLAIIELYHLMVIVKCWEWWRCISTSNVAIISIISHHSHWFN